jgi:hypothetical protein
MKDFIMDEDKIRDCISNKAKMNIFEWMWFEKLMIPQIFFDSFQSIEEGLIKIIQGFITLIIVCLFPITFPIGAYLNIRRAKQDMLKRSKYPQDRRQ